MTTLSKCNGMQDKHDTPWRPRLRYLPDEPHVGTLVHRPTSHASGPSINLSSVLLHDLLFALGAFARASRHGQQSVIVHGVARAIDDKLTKNRTLARSRLTMWSCCNTTRHKCRSASSGRQTYTELNACVQSRYTMWS